MNFLEALERVRRGERAYRETWDLNVNATLIWDEDDGFIRHYIPTGLEVWRYDRFVFKMEDMLATDWLVEE
jgi:hypothetical protein